MLKEPLVGIGCTRRKRDVSAAKDYGGVVARVNCAIYGGIPNPCGGARSANNIGDYDDDGGREQQEIGRVDWPHTR